MNATPPGGLQISQGFEVLPPRSGKAYPVPCEEWKFLKEKLSSVSTPPWILPALSFMLLGAALATLITILVGGVAKGEADKGLVIAWAVVITAGITGVASLVLGIKQHRMDRTVVREVVRQMDLIEKRFDSGVA